MRRRLILGSVVFIAAVLHAATAAAQTPDTRPGIAVLPFKTSWIGPDAEEMQPLSVGAQQLLITELAQNPALRVVDRAEIRPILEELDLARQGQVDAGTAARIGKLVGARYVLVGGISYLGGKDVHLDGRIVDVETSEIVKARRVTRNRNDMYPMFVDLASTIMRDVKLEPLAADVQAERRARKVPVEAVTLYSRAQVYQDAGQTDKAIELYRAITRRFPQMTQAREALDQLTTG